jgi:hypothetical protein
MRANPPEGFYWLDMAANKAGDMEAFGLWGQKLVQGQVCKQNIPKAKELLEKGAAGTSTLSGLGKVWGGLV